MVRASRAAGRGIPGKSAGSLPWSGSLPFPLLGDEAKKRVPDGTLLVRTSLE